MSDPKAAKVYEHDIELFDLKPGEHVTDVIILTRTVYHDEDGELQDTLKCVSTPNTTALIRAGMLEIGSQQERHGWLTEE